MSHVITLDIGGTNMRVALIDDSFRLLKVMRFPTVIGDKTAFLQQVVTAIDALEADMRLVDAISIGVPGRVRPDGYVDTLPNIKIKDIPLAAHVGATFRKPTYVKNDAVMASIAEAVLGVGKGKKRVYFVTISTGVGGALVIDGQPVYASDEIGHTLYPYKGKYHEFEQIASGTGLVKLCALNGLEVQATSLFFSLVANNNPLAQSVLADWLNLMAAFFKTIQRLFSPELIAVTGGVMKSADIFFDKLVRLVPEATILKADYGDDAGLMGSAAYAFNSLNVHS